MRELFINLEQYKSIIKSLDYQLDVLNYDKDCEPSYVSSAFGVAIPRTKMRTWDGENVGFIPQDEAIICQEEQFQVLMDKKAMYEKIVVALEEAIDKTVEECPQIHKKLAVRTMLINVLVKGEKQNEQGLSTATVSKYVNICLHKANERIER